jgi:hypothetical protein
MPLSADAKDHDAPGVRAEIDDGDRRVRSADSRHLFLQPHRDAADNITIPRASRRRSSLADRPFCFGERIMKDSALR